MVSLLIRCIKLENGLSLPLRAKKKIEFGNYSYWFDGLFLFPFYGRHDISRRNKVETVLQCRVNVPEYHCRFEIDRDIILDEGEMFGSTSLILDHQIGGWKPVVPTHPEAVTLIVSFREGNEVLETKEFPLLLP